MSNTLIVIIIAVIAVGLMVLGLSITLIFKGRNIQGDVGNNPDMKKRGLKCASQEIREEEARLRGQDLSEVLGCGGDGECGSCESSCAETPAENSSKRGRAAISSKGTSSSVKSTRKPS